MMANSEYVNDPALTYTLDQFIRMQYSDEVTYRNFSILESLNGLELLDHNLIDDYIEELNDICVSVPLTDEEYKKYRYCPDRMAYDVYGSVQVDFVILFANGMIDPKEFDIKTIKLPYASSLKKFLGEVYHSDENYIKFSRSQGNLPMYII